MTFGFLIKSRGHNVQSVILSDLKGKLVLRSGNSQTRQVKLLVDFIRKNVV